MWTSADAINAEVEYRRERVRLTSRGIRRRRFSRKVQAVVAERRLHHAVEQAADVRPEPRRGDATVPAQRASGSGTTTKQPV